MPITMTKAKAKAGVGRVGRSPLSAAERADRLSGRKKVQKRRQQAGYTDLLTTL